MRYQLTHDDILKINTYLIKSKKDSKIRYLFGRLLITISIEGLCFTISGIIANVWVFLVGLILVVPIWLYTKKIHSKLISWRLRRLVKKNAAILSERTVEIINGNVVIEMLGSIPLAQIKSVHIEDGILYYEVYGETKGIPLTSFKSEAEKGQFIDSFKAGVR